MNRSDLQQTAKISPELLDYRFDEQTDELEKSQYRADLEDYLRWLDKTE